MGLNLAVSLWKPGAPVTGRSTEVIAGEIIPVALGDVPVQLDQAAWVGVADGHYRLVVHSGSRSSRASGQAARQFSTLHLDFSELPREVDIRGKTIDLPPIRATLVDELTVTGPTENAQIDPRKTVLQWDAFPLAATYKVTIWRTERTPGGGVYFKDSYTASTTSANLALADVPLEEINKLGLGRPGGTGAWSVEALDTQGRWIARSRAQRSFVISNKSKPQ
jgi:hypothetical protein